MRYRDRRSSISPMARGERSTVRVVRVEYFACILTWPGWGSSSPGPLNPVFSTPSTRPQYLPGTTIVHVCTAVIEGKEREKE